MLKGKKILITSGPTRAPLDAVRYLSNISTGYFGILLAKEALRKGARVTFVYGIGSLTPPRHPRLKMLSVETNEDVGKTLKRELTGGRHDAVVHAMAVLDFQAKKISKKKTATRKGSWVLTLRPTPKIINQIKKWDPNIFLVGFKLEVGLSQKGLLKRARRLAKQSRADLILANQLPQGEDTKHIGLLLDRTGRIIGESRGKQNLAKMILVEMARFL